MVIAGVSAFVLVFGVVLARRPRIEREPRPGPDYGAMAEIEEHDTDDMLEAIDERRRRRGARSVGDELADELMRGTWDES